MAELKLTGENPFGPVVERFNNQGWHLHPKMLDPANAATVREYLESRIQWMHQEFEKWVGSPLTAAKSYSWHQGKTAEYEANGLPDDLSHYLHGEFDLETRMNDRITSILASQRCQQIITEFMGIDRYYVHYPPMIRFKLPGTPGSFVPVHQDFAYNEHLSQFMTIWMPFVDVDEECGGLVMHEGSQLSPLTEHQPSGAWANKASADLSGYSPKHILMRAGDALMFPPTLFHESAPHTSKTTTRLSIDFRVFPKITDTTKSYYNPVSNTIVRQH